MGDAATGTVTGGPQAPAPDALVAAARLIARGYRRGGRLIVDGRGRAAADARHVVVEFMHPVTVGRRALPARLGPAGGGDGDVTLSIAYAGAAAVPDAAIALTDEAPGPGTIWLALPAGDASAAKVHAVLAYHVLWELVHPFLDGDLPDGDQPGGDLPADDPSGADAAGPATAGPGAEAAAAALYPMLYPATGERAAGDAVAAAVRSAAAKLAESADVRARAVTDNRDAIAAAAALVRGADAVYTFGNGGSSTDAADAAYAIGPHASALSDDVATVTALANDVSFDVVFARQLATVGRAGDCAIAFSTSGNSPNVIAAASAARAIGMSTIGLAGYDGGEIATSGLFDVVLVVRSDSVHRVQEAQAELMGRILGAIGDAPRSVARPV